MVHRAWSVACAAVQTSPFKGAHGRVRDAAKCRLRSSASGVKNAKPECLFRRSRSSTSSAYLSRRGSAARLVPPSMPRARSLSGASPCWCTGRASTRYRCPVRQIRTCNDLSVQQSICAVCRALCSVCMLFMCRQTVKAQTLSDNPFAPSSAGAGFRGAAGGHLHLQRATQVVPAQRLPAPPPRRAAGEAPWQDTNGHGARIATPAELPAVHLCSSGRQSGSCFNTGTAASGCRLGSQTLSCAGTTAKTAALTKAWPACPQEPLLGDAALTWQHQTPSASVPVPGWGRPPLPPARPRAIGSSYTMARR